MRFDAHFQIGMPSQGHDILIAFKAISLAPDLSVTDKRVASALVDHFNKWTRQCDPSLDTLASILGTHRRTVIRSVGRLVRLKYFRRTRHGGNFHRNFYEPLWSRFHEVEAEWQRRRRAHSQRFHEEKLSRWKGQIAHPASGVDATQTCLRNLSNETLSTHSIRERSPAQIPLDDPKKIASKEHCSSIPTHARPMFHVNETSSRKAAYAAAERRWSTSLHDRYVATSTVYGEIINAIDSATQRAATEAEIKRRGAGLAYILDQLKARNIRC